MSQPGHYGDVAEVAIGAYVDGIQVRIYGQEAGVGEPRLEIVGHPAATKLRCIMLRCVLYITRLFDCSTVTANPRPCDPASETATAAMDAITTFTTRQKRLMQWLHGQIR